MLQVPKVLGRSLNLILKTKGSHEGLQPLGNLHQIPRGPPKCGTILVRTVQLQLQDKPSEPCHWECGSQNSSTSLPRELTGNAGT